MNVSFWSWVTTAGGAGALPGTALWVHGFLLRRSEPTSLLILSAAPPCSGLLTLWGNLGCFSAPTSRGRALVKALQAALLDSGLRAETGIQQALGGTQVLIVLFIRRLFAPAVGGPV